LSTGCRKILAPDARVNSIVMIWLAPEASIKLAKSFGAYGRRASSSSYLVGRKESKS